MKWLLDKFKQEIFTRENIILILLVSLPCIILYRPAFENDTYWILNTGRYILTNGFPKVDPFTIHNSLNITIQQWATTVVFYYLYNALGALALYILNILQYYFICFMLYKTALITGKGNKIVAIIITGTAAIYLSFFIVLRPQVFSLMIFIGTIYLLERYTRSPKYKTIILLPVMSVLLINFHGAMWFMMFLIILPYIIDGIKIPIQELSLNTQVYPVKPLIITTFVAVMGGVLNPYTIKNMLYLFNAYGDDLVNNYINEMSSPNFKTPLGILVFIMILTVVLIYAKHKEHARTRYIFITIGTAFMALSSIRSFPVFVVCSLPYLASALQDLRYTEKVNNQRQFKVVLIATLMVITLLLGVKRYDYTEYVSTFTPVGAVNYLKKEVTTNNVVLFNTYEDGGYIEHAGLKAFIDSRAEVFLKRFNKKEDIFEDYINIMTGKIHYKELESKYRFNHYLVKKGHSLDTYLRRDIGYKKIYEDTQYVLYKKTI